VGFTRLRGVKSGQTRSWSLQITADTLAVTDGAGARVLLPGVHTLRLGEAGVEARVVVEGLHPTVVVPASAALRALSGGR
jgi:hypothetical protein